MESGGFNAEKYLRDSQEELNKTSKDEKVLNVPIALICPNRFQPRMEFLDHKTGESLILYIPLPSNRISSKLQDLANSIKEKGVIQPVILREISDQDDYRFELIAGERRTRASVLAGLETVPAIVRDADDERSQTEALIENLHRDDLDTVEKTRALLNLLEKFDGDMERVSVASTLGRKQVEKYRRIGNAFYSQEDIKQLFLESHDLEFTTALEMVPHIERLVRLEKSNNRAFYRTLKVLQKRGVNKESLSYLACKFRDEKKSCEIPRQNVQISFMENKKTGITLSIKIHNIALTGEERQEIQEAVDKLLNMVSL